jgi:prefoldin subunit 5
MSMPVGTDGGWDAADEYIDEHVLDLETEIEALLEQLAGKEGVIEGLRSELQYYKYAATRNEQTDIDARAPYRERVTAESSSEILRSISEDHTSRGISLAEELSRASSSSPKNTKDLEQQLRLLQSKCTTLEARATSHSVLYSHYATRPVPERLSEGYGTH